MKQKILDAGLRAAEVDHYAYITRAKVAAEAGCPDSLVSYYFNSMLNLRAAILSEAIRVKHWQILAQALANQDKEVESMRDEIAKHLYVGA